MKRVLQWLLGRDGSNGGGGGAATPAPGPGSVLAVPAPGATPLAPTLTAPVSVQAGASPPELQYLAWLTGDAPVAGDITAAERQLLGHLDDMTRREDARSELVPRARAIIPQLMHSLRDESQSAQALSARVARDPNLVVEVLRLANNVGYGSGTPVADLTQAIGRLGTEGLRRAIARILLKPIFDAQADPLLARTADRLWQHAEATAALCAQMAAVARVDAFDAFLAGLMYNVGWTATFRALGRAPGGAPAAMSAAFAGALNHRRELLFAHLLRSWSLSDSLSALADEILATSPTRPTSPSSAPGTRLPVGTLLRSADRAALLQLLRSQAIRAPASDVTGR
jgi:HD-like signal output (HDOD) protein